MKRLFLIATAASFACGGGSGTGSPSAPTLAPPGPGTIAQGTLRVPDGQLHLAFDRSHVIPTGASGVAGQRIVVSLRDATRPGQTCSQDHPLSGCATVDWSEFPSIVFDNSLVVTLATGPRTFFLSETRGLADSPDAFVPG